MVRISVDFEPEIFTMRSLRMTLHTTSSSGREQARGKTETRQGTLTPNRGSFRFQDLLSLFLRPQFIDLISRYLIGFCTAANWRYDQPILNPRFPERKLVIEFQVMT